MEYVPLSLATVLVACQPAVYGLYACHLLLVSLLDRVIQHNQQRPLLPQDDFKYIDF